MMPPDERRSGALSHFAARFAAARSASFSLGEAGFIAQLNLRGPASDAHFAHAVRAALGCELPSANRWSGTPARGVLWLGPDEWLVVAPDAEREALLAALERALRDTRHALTDVSANRTVLDLSGSDARVLLARGCPLDLHAGAFGPGQVAQSLLARIEVILQCVAADVPQASAFRLFVRNSFAEYAALWLLDAAAEAAAARALGMRQHAERMSAEEVQVSRAADTLQQSSR
jgi:sarcosine oxidase subunit gamma